MRQWLEAERSYFGFASRGECEGSDIEIMSLKAISACQNIFFKRRRQRDNKLTAFALSFFLFLGVVITFSLRDGLPFFPKKILYQHERRDFRNVFIKILVDVSEVS